MSEQSCEPCVGQTLQGSGAGVSCRPTSMGYVPPLVLLEAELKQRCCYSGSKRRGGCAIPSATTKLCREMRRAW